MSDDVQPPASRSAGEPAQRASAGGAGNLRRSERARVIAAFDFDGTLSTRDNFWPFVRTVAGRRRTARAVVLALPLLAAAALRDDRRNAAKAALVRRTLAGRGVGEVAEIAERFADDVVARHLRADAVERAEWHRHQGHELVIVSASLDVYLRPIADRLDFDAVLGTALEVGGDGRFTGRLSGTNVRRAEKARRLDAWLGGTPAFVWAYGDSTGDRELFERADRAIRIGHGRIGHGRIGHGRIGHGRVGR